MKKLVVLLASLLLLVGCSDAYASVSDAKSPLFTVGNTTVTKGEVYSSLVELAGAYQLMNDVTKVIYDIEVPVNEEIEATAEAQIDFYQTNYGELFDYFLQANGFANLETFRETMIRSAQASALYDKYVRVNYDTIKEEQDPYKIVLFEFETSENADAALADLNSGKDPVETAALYESTTNGTEELLCAKTSSYPVELKAAISSAEKDVYTKVAGTNGSYFVFKVTENDKDALLEDVVTRLVSDKDTQNNAMKYYFGQYRFSVFDKTLHDDIVENYADFYSGK